jgi:hypothetical protein
MHKINPTNWCAFAMHNQNATEQQPTRPESDREQFRFNVEHTSLHHNAADRDMG